MASRRTETRARLKEEKRREICEANHKTIFASENTEGEVL